MNTLFSDKPLNFVDGVSFVDDIVRDSLANGTPCLGMLDCLVSLDLGQEVNDGISKAAFIVRECFASGEPVLVKLNELKNTY